MVPCSAPRGANALRVVWHVFISILLWTPVNSHRKFTLNASKRLYFQYQSYFVHVVVTYMTGVSILSHVALLGFAFWFQTSYSYTLTIVGIIFIICNLGIISWVYLLPKIVPYFKNGKFLYLRIYLPLFLSFIGSGVSIFGLWITQNRNSVGNLSSVFFFYISIILTFYFQWSTLLSVLMTIFYLSCFVAAYTGYYLIEEVSALATNNIIATNPNVLLFSENLHVHYDGDHRYAQCISPYSDQSSDELSLPKG